MTHSSPKTRYRRALARSGRGVFNLIGARWLGSVALCGLTGFLAPGLARANDDCSLARISFETTTPVFALKGSLFGDRLYVQGDGSWTPRQIVAKATLPSGAAAVGCHVRVYPQAVDDGRFFYSDAQKTDQNGTVRGYWFADTNPDPVLVADNAQNIQQRATLAGHVSQLPFTAAGAHVRYINYKANGASDWRAFSVSMTPVTSGRYMYYAAMNWWGGYLGLQQTGTTFLAPHSRKLIMTLWDAGHGLPKVVNDPYKICGDAVAGTAEGDLLQCFSDYDFHLGETYTFTVRAEHVVSGALDYTLHLKGKNDSGFPDDFDVFTIRVPNPDDFYPSIPLSFLENYISGNPSCADVEQTLIIYSDIWYTPGKGGGQYPVTDVSFDRGLDAASGGSDVCFNYDYGDTDVLPVAGGFGGTAPNVKGFYMSTGGMDLVGPPEINDPYHYAGSHWTLNEPYFQITSNNALGQLAQSDQLGQLFADHAKIAAITQDGAWVGTIRLPDHVAEGSKFSLTVNSTLPVNLFANGSDRAFTKGESAELVFSHNQWFDQDAVIQTDYYVVPTDALSLLSNSSDYLKQLYLQHDSIEVDTADGAWTGRVILPTGIRNGSRFKLVVNSTWSVALNVDGSETEVAKGETAELTYRGGKWLEVKKSLSN
ncbi:hypothetical protein [Martelella sp. HB161492]|uniref:DUF3472 domain-containing protein n=1 Tax=Martelella sp. HB161492 TaxID=2720726 RepID=UPI00159237F3|nr:hypothetical protein [Martelella sp. HB161492]